MTAASLTKGTDRRLRVLVVDDSAVVRGLIARQLATDPEVAVVATAANGQLALDELDRRPIDVAVLDIEMPVMDGMAALAAMRMRHPQVKVVMASTFTQRNAEISLKALSLGACDYIAKPEGSLGSAAAFQQELLAKVKAVGRIARAPSVALKAPTAFVSRTPRAERVRPSVIAIGASTGGPPALLKVFEAMRGAVDQPILLTQHMPAVFTGLLAEQLERAGQRPCAEGIDGQVVERGRCYVAPGGFHMTVHRRGTSKVIRLDREAPENFCRPAVDPMLRSVAEAYGNGALVVILTGMGSDGAKGCDAVARAGGRIVIQDEATSVVWGMPGAAAATGLTECALSIHEVGPWIVRTAEEII